MYLDTWAESSGATCRARRFVPSSAPSRALRSPPIFSRSPRASDCLHIKQCGASSKGQPPIGSRPSSTMDRATRSTRTSRRARACRSSSGTDPEGGPWELYLEPTNEGTGLGFGFTGGGGGGCCLQPLKDDFRLDGWGSGSGEPSDITALASEAVTRLEFEAASGERIEGALDPVPDASLGIRRSAWSSCRRTSPSKASSSRTTSAGTNSHERTSYVTARSPLARRRRSTSSGIGSGGLAMTFRSTRLDMRGRSPVSTRPKQGRSIGHRRRPRTRWNDGPLASGDVSIRGVARGWLRAHRPIGLERRPGVRDRRSERVGRGL